MTSSTEPPVCTGGFFFARRGPRLASPAVLPARDLMSREPSLRTNLTHPTPSQNSSPPWSRSGANDCPPARGATRRSGTVATTVMKDPGRLRKRTSVPVSSGRSGIPAVNYASRRTLLPVCRNFPCTKKGRSLFPLPYKTGLYWKRRRHGQLSRQFADNFPSSY